MKLLKSASVEQIVGPTIANVLPVHSKPWFMVPHLLKLNLLIVIPLLSSAAGGFDGSLMNGLQSMTTWKDQYNNPQGLKLGFVNAVMCFGGLLGLYPSAWLPDKYGRKITLLLGIIGIIIATIVQATSKGSVQLIIARFILGVAGQLAGSPSPMMIAELAYPTYRGKCTSLFNTLFYVGGILASWSCYGCTSRSDSWSWRIPVCLQGLLPVIQLIFIYWVPESPRWLVSKGRVDEAREILIEFHAGGDRESPLVEVEIDEILAAIELEKKANSTKWTDLFATPGNRRRSYIGLTLGLASQWTGLSVITYYLTLVLDTIGITSSTMQTLINGILQIFNFIAAVSGAMLVDYFGRRTLFLWSGVGMLCSYIVWTACSATFAQTASAGSGKAVLGFIFIFAFHYDIAYTPLAVAYPTEIFPYSLRAKGTTMVMSVVYSGLLIVSFCNPIAMAKIGWKYYIVFCVMLFLICLNTYFFFPETKGHSLEEIALIFDGNSVIDLEVGSKRGIDDDDDEKKKTVVQHVETVDTSE